jgi:hypothetical protein
VNVETLSLETRKAIRDRLKFLSDSVQMIESLPQPEIAKIVRAKFVAEEPGELFILLEEAALPVGTEDMVTVFDLLDDGCQFPAQSFVQPSAEDFADAVRSQPPEAQFTASLEDFVDREVPFENEGSSEKIVGALGLGQLAK